MTPSLTRHPQNIRGLYVRIEQVVLQHTVSGDASWTLFYIILLTHSGWLLYDYILL